MIFSHGNKELLSWPKYQSVMKKKMFAMYQRNVCLFLNYEMSGIDLKIRTHVRILRIQNEILRL